MIEGLNIRCNIGNVEIIRSPLIELIYKRRAVLSRALIHIPDSQGDIRAMLEVDQDITIRFGYRGEQNFWHEWKGTITNIDQPVKNSINPDAIIVRGVGLEKKLCTTYITETFQDEPAQTMAKRLLAKTGLPLGTINIPDDVLPHQIFSNIPISRALKQLEHSLQRSFGRDLSRHAIWLGQNGLMWSDDIEHGDIFNIETGQNLISHTPPIKSCEMGLISSVLLPSLTDSRQIRIQDKRRNINSIERAEEVIHTLKRNGNITSILYGKQLGWG